MITTDEYKVRKVKHPHAIDVEVPGSKSITNRALLIAALAQGKSVLRGVLFSDDSRHFLQALIDLGFDVTIDEPSRMVEIVGCGGNIPAYTAEAKGNAVNLLESADSENLIGPLPYTAEVNVGSAGTAARFLTAFLGLSKGRYRMDASEQMKARPMKELLTALVSLGVQIDYEEEEFHFPYVIGQASEAGSAGEGKASITIDVDKSSQFLSALLITSVLFTNGITINVTGSHGMAYVRMTVAMMRQFGLTIDVSEDERTYTIPAGASYEPKDYVIEPDLSAACYFYAAGAILGVPAKVKHVHRDCMQGDVQFLSVLCDMGCTIREDDDGITLIPNEMIPAQPNEIISAQPKMISARPDKGGLHGGCWDLSSFSDQALTLAAIAPFADSPVEIRGIGHICYQECDRIRAIVENLRAMGVRCEELNSTAHYKNTSDTIRLQGEKSCGTAHCKQPVGRMEMRGLGTDGVVIYPAANASGARIRTFDDHRVAMAFAIPGLLLDGQVIMNPSCCRKTFEDFFEVLEVAVIERGD